MGGDGFLSHNTPNKGTHVMKKTFASIAVSGLVLAACGGGGGNSALQADCKILAADPEAMENFEEMGTDAAGFCDCFIKVVNAKPDTEQAQMKSALERVTDGMEETGQGAEEVVGPMMREIMLESSQAGEESDLGAGIRLIGQAIDEIGEGFEDGGSCPAA